MNTPHIGRLFLLGDSYSTFTGYIPEGYAVYYRPEGRPETDVTAVEQTWWHHLLRETDAELVRNCSWSGSTICHTGYDGEDCCKKSFIARFDRLAAEGFFADHPVDTVLIFGGTNDTWAGSPLGEEIRDGQTAADLYAVIPAIYYLARRMREVLPDARVVFLENTGLKPEIVAAMRDAAAAYGHGHLPLCDIDKSHGHPTILGMRRIADQVKAGL